MLSLRALRFAPRAVSHRLLSTSAAFVAELNKIPRSADPLVDLDSAAKDLDWGELLHSMKSHEAKLELENLRHQYHDLVKSVDSLRRVPTDIDWEFWRKDIAAAGLVDSLQKAYTSVQLPQLNVNTELDSGSKFQSLLDAAEQTAVLTQQRLADVNHQLEELKGTKALEELSVDEELAQNPALAAEIDKEIANNEWRL